MQASEEHKVEPTTPNDNLLPTQQFACNEQLPNDSLANRIQIVNDRKMLDGKFYVMDSDDSDEEGLYRQTDANQNEPKQRTYKRLQKKARAESDSDEQLDKEELDELKGGSLDNIQMYSEAH